MTYELTFGAVPNRQKKPNKPQIKTKSSPINAGILRNGYGSFVAGFVLGVLLTMIGMRLWQTRFPDGSGLTPGGPITGAVDDSRGGNYPGPSPVTGARTLRVRSQNVAMRNCPAMNCQVISVLPEGTAVSMIERGPFVDNSEWVKISIRGQEGWVSRYYLE